MKMERYNDPKDRKKPLYSTMEITEDEYEDFWTWTETWCARWLSFFNDDIFGAGVPLPYQKLSFLTHLTFHPRAMLIVLGLYYNN